ncbi:MAG: MFS transporter [Gammaproteobacteria bacterium]|nr:MFS transporter [Gammaproteobacteria bacterium]
MRVGIKLGYGIGQAADGAKQAAFNTFLLFYYNQVLGLPATLAGLAALIALAVDAITDPMMGQISDRFRSKWGRRHPFMFAGALPFAIAMYALFTPVSGLSTYALFAWMVFWAVTLRLMLTVFFVPHLALGAELSDDYHERTSLIGYRVFFTYTAILSLSIIVLMTFLKNTEAYPNGMLNPDGYPMLGLLCGVVGGLAMLLSAFTTRSTIPLLKQPAATSDKRNPLFAVIDVFKALKLDSFRVIFSANLLFNIMAGVIQALLIYVATYVYGFDSKYFAFLTLALVISVICAPWIAQLVSKRIGKKNTLAVSIFLGASIAFAPLIVYLLFGLDFMNLDQKLIFVFVCNGFGNAFFIAYVIMIDSMITDTIDENELLTGRREEGLFFAARAFCTKASYGLGAFFAGLSLDIIKFPKQADPRDVDPGTITDLAILAGPVCLLMFLATILISNRYGLTQQRHQEIVTQIAARA